MVFWRKDKRKDGVREAFLMIMTEVNSCVTVTAYSVVDTGDRLLNMFKMCVSFTINIRINKIQGNSYESEIY